MKTMAVNFKQIWRVNTVIVLCLFLFPLLSLSQTDTSKKLKEVKISSSAAPKVNDPISSQQITAADFNRYSAFNVADAIRDFAGVYIKDYGGIGGLKTISVRGLGANHTGVLYDGMQLNDTENGQVDLGKLNLNNVQEITLYNGQPYNICQPARSFAFSSILSIHTIKPSLSPDKPFLITAGIKEGSFGLVNPFLQWQERLNKNWSFIVNSYLENANGRYSFGTDTLHTRTNADVSVQQVDGALYWTKNDSNKFSLHVNYYNSDRGLPGAIILYSADVSRQRLWNSDFFTQASYEHQWQGGLHLLLNSKIAQNYLRYLNPDYLNADGKLDQRFTQRELYQSAALAYHFTPLWEVSYATDFSLNNLNTNLFNFAYPTRLTILNVLASNLTLGKLLVQSSVLNTHINESVKTGRGAPTRNIFSPTLLASLKPFANSDFQVRGFYKYIFRNPTFDDLYYGGIGNPNLKPEFTDQYDLGFTYGKNLTDFLEYITLTADAYYNKVKNKIVFIPRDAYNGSIQNFGNVDVKGLDLALKTRLKLTTEWLASLSADYTYQQAQNVTDPSSSVYLNQLPYTPKNSVALNVGVDHSHIGIYYNQILSSSRYYTNDNLSSDFIPSYSVSDISVIYKSLAKRSPVTASFQVNNLFNKTYVVVQSYPMPGRSFRFSIQITI